MNVSMRVTPFQIDVPDGTLTDLAAHWIGPVSPVRRTPVIGCAVPIAATSAARATTGGTSSTGARPGSRAEPLRAFRVELGGLGLHFIHERGRGPAPLPIVLTHGYPDSFLRFLEADPAARPIRRRTAGTPADAFDVVVPSLPGYGFSDPPGQPGATFRIGELWHTLMTDDARLRSATPRTAATGAAPSPSSSRAAMPAPVVGIHLTDVPFWHAFQKPSRSAVRRGRAVPRGIEQLVQQEGAYAMIQGTRPQTPGDRR